ncbi:hypothetical protein WAI453_013583 [Rhynchosporium graminicola]
MSKGRASIPAPKLLGLVINNGGVVLGISEEFIENEGTLSDMVKKDTGVLNERRAKWAKQIQEGIELLHENGVV